MKIVVLDGHTLAADGNSWDGLLPLGEVVVHERSSPEQVAERARPATVVITNKCRITAEVIAGCSALRCVAVTGTGYDCVDGTAAGRRGIAVCNVPGYGTDSVAQFAFALLLELCHHAGDHARAVAAGEWGRVPDFCFWSTPLIELAGKTLGLVGHGQIGRRVGELGHAFGMKVLACNRSQANAPAYQPFAWSGLDELLSASDVISLHCPLTPETAGLINRDRLRRVRHGAFLVNTSRGGLIIEQDLADALNEGRLAGTAVDVVSIEPVRPDNPLLSARNCLITPHIAWATREARRRLLDATVANVANFINGRPTNVVNR